MYKSSEKSELGTAYRNMLHAFRHPVVTCCHMLGVVVNIFANLGMENPVNLNHKSYCIVYNDWLQVSK